ncbi:VOC family protein [Amycolatopsis acidicola]|uniref:VOC family protein n=1 Tax=Amycolatopsis acidicola TaxID=2596893 RepID=A0A5N0VGX0_9PSEU|nr:VOC family protein [Amycolatopsis acidicola]KAA9165597.1 VOC family protein [Amycolatopsis acidicola]
MNEWPKGLRVTQVRVARPTDRLAEVVEFYSGCLGLPELYRFIGHAGYDGVLLGLPGVGHHLEFTSHVDGSPCPAPTAENLLVLYFDGESAMYETVARLGDAGHEPVPLENPYWAENGALGFADPDGWLVVLVPRPALH